MIFPRIAILIFSMILSNKQIKDYIAVKLMVLMDGQKFFLSQHFSLEINSKKNNKNNEIKNVKPIKIKLK